MPSSNLHIIQKQSLDLTVSREHNSLALQQRFERMLEEKLMPKLTPVFDRLAGPNVYLEIDMLEVDLGYINPQASESECLDIMYKAYTDALNKQTSNPKLIKSSNPSENTIEILAHFLQRGYLPWWAEGFQLEAAIQKLLPHSASQIIQCLSSSIARRRWVRQFDAKIQEALWKSTSKKLSISLMQWQSIFPKQIHAELKYTYWETAWEAFLGQKDSQDAQLMLFSQRIHSMLPDDFDEKKIQYFFNKNNNLSEKYKNKLIEIIIEFNNFFSENKKITEVNQGNNDPFSETPQIDFTSKIEARQIPKGDSFTADEIFISLAGIVLIHPFLPAFFECLGWLKAGQFRDAASQERAVHLLYFLATAQVYPDEEELVLFKLLCGMDVETPIAKEVDLSAAEKTEALDLLHAVITKWTAVEGSSPDDIRATFFLREGKLCQSDMGWQLNVEEKIFDILLTKLPWGLSPIMHSWMPKMIWVDWT